MADTVEEGPAWSGNAETNPPPTMIAPPIPSPEIIFPVVNADVAPFVEGMPITKSRKLGNASSLLTSYLIGICVSGAAPGFSGDVQCEGKVTLPTASWDAVTGQVGGLSSGMIYYLHTASGQMRAFAPVTVGESVVIVGVALTADTLICSNPYLVVLL